MSGPFTFFLEILIILDYGLKRDVMTWMCKRNSILIKRLYSKVKRAIGLQK